MQQDLDTLKNEIAAALDVSGFAVCHGLDRLSDPMPIVRWDVEQYPDPRAYLEMARKAGVKILVFHHRRFASVAALDALADLQSAEISREDHREFDRRLRQFMDYDGFTCLVELSFLSDGVWYVYETATRWYDEFLGILSEIHDAIDVSEDDDDKEPGPLGGYFSHN
jgi:hypothetical protein